MLPCYKASQLYSAWPSSTAIATWNVEFWCRILQPLNGPKPTKKAVIHTLFTHLVSTWNMLPNIKFKDYMQPWIHGSFTWPTGCSQGCTQLLRVASGCSKLWLPRVVWVHLPKQIKVFFHASFSGLHSGLLFFGGFVCCHSGGSGGTCCDRFGRGQVPLAEKEFGGLKGWGRSWTHEFVGSFESQSTCFFSLSNL